MTERCDDPDFWKTLCKSGLKVCGIGETKERGKKKKDWRQSGGQTVVFSINLANFFN